RGRRSKKVVALHGVPPRDREGLAADILTDLEKAAAREQSVRELIGTRVETGLIHRVDARADVFPRQPIALTPEAVVATVDRPRSIVAVRRSDELAAHLLHVDRTIEAAWGKPRAGLAS